MLRFLTKTEVWGHLDNRVHAELGWKNVDIHLKTWQDVAVYEHVRALSGQRIAEIGGGNSRILRAIAERNDCVNVDKLLGQHGGPLGDQNIPNVRTVPAFLGEFDPALEDNSFDFVISVSVIEHVPPHQAGDFLEDLCRILRVGGKTIHAIDMYVGDEPIPAAQHRLDLYRNWLTRAGVRPLGPIEARDAVFSSAMATNPDLTLWHWNRAAPALKDLRARTQSVSLLLGFEKIA